jgi:hypothetical protein
VILRPTRRALLLGLGILAGAVLPARGEAQVPVRRDTLPTRRDTLPVRRDTLPTRRDTIPARRADSTVKSDSLAKSVVPLPVTAQRDTIKAPKPDTIKPPLAHSEAPPVLEIGVPRVYDRTAMFATGAIMLSDLLSRVPGLTEFTTGWVDAPSVVASQGNLRNIRIFLDGIELDPLDRRSQGVAPVNDLPLHELEEVRIERGAEQVRVYAKTWRVDRTDPYTRADIATGDQSTNLYRAYYGKRFDHGEALQFSAEQSSTQPNRNLASTSALHVMGRFGLTRGPWNGDLFAERTDRDRGQWTGSGAFFQNLDTIPAWETRRNTAYLRLANGDPDRGRWFQMLASSQSFHGSPRVSSPFSSILSPSTGPALPAVPDSTAYENQYLLTGGLTRGNMRASLAERVRSASQRTSHVLSGRASYEHPLLAVSLFGEGQSALAPSRLEGTVRLAPFDRVALLASASRTGSATVSRIFGQFQPTLLFTADGTLQPPFPNVIGGYDSTTVDRYQLAPSTNFRAEAGVRLRDVWVNGGVVRRGPTALLPAAEFDTAYARPTSLRIEGPATGATASIHGRLYKAINVDAWGVAWSDSTGLYRPQYQTRSELYIQTNLLDRFPRGNFGLLTSLVHEYRSNTRFAQADGTERTAIGYRAISFKLEIRIQTAVVSYQFRNLLQESYAQVPGYLLPRQTQFYGVRWDFWN